MKKFVFSILIFAFITGCDHLESESYERNQGVRIKSESNNNNSEPPTNTTTKTTVSIDNIVKGRNVFQMEVENGVRGCFDREKWH